MWICPGCGSANELDACWRCRAPRATADPYAGAPAPPPAPVTPPWAAMPPPRRSPWRILAVALLAVGIGAVGIFELGRVATGLLAPSVALAAPSSIDGLPRVAGDDPAAATLGGLHLVDVVSATYGSGDVRYTIVAISATAVLGGRSSLAQVVGPEVVGDAGIDEASRTSVDRDGATITCWRMTAAVTGVTCTWTAGGVTGVAVQVGSADIGRAVDFTASARRGLERH